MRRTEWLLGFLLVAGMLAIPAVLSWRSPVSAGETVRPQWLSGDVWAAGRANDVTVSLLAVGTDGTSTRPLSFQGIPYNSNPTATVNFYRGEESLSPVEVVLSHRC